MAELHQSAMGKKFYEKDIPAILGQLKRIADALEKENTLTEKRLKMEHVSFVKEQRSTKAGTDYKPFQSNSNGPKTVED